MKKKYEVVRNNRKVMLELKGDFVNYIAGVRTSSVSMGLASHLKVSPSPGEIYLRAVGKVANRKARVPFKAFKLNI